MYELKLKHCGLVCDDPEQSAAFVGGWAAASLSLSLSPDESLTGRQNQVS